MRSDFVEVHGVDLDAWIARHGLVVDDGLTCGGCGAPAYMTIPIACGDLRGVACPPCECGYPETMQYAFVLGASHEGDRGSLSAMFGQLAPKRNRNKRKAKVIPIGRGEEPKP